MARNIMNMDGKLMFYKPPQINGVFPFTGEMAPKSVFTPSTPMKE
jgi:hypothetical protein